MSKQVVYILTILPNRNKCLAETIRSVFYKSRYGTVYVDEIPSSTDKLVSLSNKNTRYLNEMRLSILAQQITAKCNSTQKSFDTARTIPSHPRPGTQWGTYQRERGPALNPAIMARGPVSSVRATYHNVTACKALPSQNIVSWMYLLHDRVQGSAL
jgi:hypothetical protein